MIKTSLFTSERGWRTEIKQPDHVESAKVTINGLSIYVFLDPDCQVGVNIFNDRHEFIAGFRQGDDKFRVEETEEVIDEF